MIQTFVSKDQFAFRSGTKLLGSLPLKTLELTISEEATPDEAREIRFLSEDYIPGEVISVKQLSEDPLVLGPDRAFTHEITLHACGNPDRRQYANIAPRKTVRVCGIEEAREVFAAYRTRYNMGAGNCAKEHGTVWELPSGKGGKRKRVGRVSYNGRYATLAEIKAFQAEMAAKYGTKLGS